MIRQFCNIMYLLLIEIIFGAYGLLFLYSIEKKEVPLFSYFAFVMFGSISFSLLLLKFREKAKLLFLIFILPILYFLGKWLGFDPFANLLIALLIFWRTLSHFNEQDKQNEGKWILFTILTGIFLIYFSGLTSEKNMKLIGAIMILQVGFIIIGGFFHRWLDMNVKIRHKKQFFLPLLAIVSGISVIGFILALGMKLYEKLFFSFLSVIVAIIAFISSPFFNWAENQDWSEKVAFLNNDQVLQEETADPDVLEGLGRQAAIDPAIIGAIVLVVSSIFIFIYIYKRYKMKRAEDSIERNSAFSTESFSLSRDGLFFQKDTMKPSADSIRKEIYTFEKFAKKRKLGRFPFETLSDWFKRIEISDYNEINTIYEKLRYGLIPYTDNELKLVKEKLQLKKQELREKERELIRHKNN
ncbi:hypothetical protein F7731_06820 [Cytobacillus depressus]|uniref:DUF4129 domain-containing protein n=1 Tax=Cytobacillus depressus TaxID=1602942 RepID=A0A6L3VDH9_9BACI|nr:hypothetical protein [Cytobacillus depressus]KAB2337321.1 hypothetical protein F7731_06820 [Cytobacillus depressus]